MKRVLITGANSYIGTSVEYYIAEHYPEECIFCTVDLLDDTWRDISFAEYDVVFHVAGIAHIKETKQNSELYYKVNRDLAVEVASKAKMEQVKQFIFLSSMSVYGLLKGCITAETKPLPKSDYGRSKLQAEEKLQTLADDTFKVCVLRPPMIYGRNCKGNYQTLRKFALKFKVFPYVKNKRSMLYIENFCEFIRFMILNEESGIFFPQNSEYTNTSNMVKSIAAAYGRKLYFIHGVGWIIKFMGLFTKIIKKAFGNLIYDKTLSDYIQDYCVVSLNDSIRDSESQVKQ